MASPVAPTAEPAAPARVHVRAFELQEALEFYAPHIKVLSLDCFDTLLWRQTAQPMDVFFELQRDPAAKAVGLTASARSAAEDGARRMSKVRGEGTEVTLADIYSAKNLALTLTDAERAALIEAELQAEEKMLFGFPPVVELIHAAKARGLQVVLVSDTYLTEAQLRRLLKKALPAGTLEAIDRIFVSCEHGRGKNAGLFLDVMAAMKVEPLQMLHIGDHQISDLIAPRKCGIQALQLLQQELVVEQILRLQMLAYNLQHAPSRKTDPLTMPYRALFASQPQPTEPARVLGYIGSGPLLYSFGRFILDELAALRAEGKKVKPLFLLRDAHLPQRVCNAIAGEEVGAAVSISRFAAQAAAFRTPADVDDYLMRSVRIVRLEPFAKQLLLPDELANAIIKKANQSEDPIAEFNRQVRKPETMKIIFARSKSHRERLFRHIESKVQLERGDTLVFIDLGYIGNVQRLLGPVFQDEKGIEIFGRYLLTMPTMGWNPHTRKALIDATIVDDRATAVLFYNRNVALLEDLCTTDTPSVNGYEEDGRPIFVEKVIASAQHQRLLAIQEHCVQFARDAERFFAKVGQRPPLALLRADALGSLTRLLFFTSEAEINCLEGFRIDVNLATEDTFRLFDREQGLLGLQRRGLFSIDTSKETLRTNYPVEMRSASLTLSLTLLAAGRYSLDFNQSDVTLRREPIKVLFIRGADSTSKELHAVATYDGYFALVVPFSDGTLNLGILFGARYSWLQIESIQAIRTDHLFKDTEAVYARDIGASYDGMIERGKGVFECQSPAAFMMPIPPKLSDMPAAQREGFAKSMVCRIVFRPLTRRG